MKTKEIIERARNFAKPFRIADGSSFSLKHIDPGDTLDFEAVDKPRAKEALATAVEALAELQPMLYAQERWACCSSFSPRMQPPRTAPSSTSCTTGSSTRHEG